MRGRLLPRFVSLAVATIVATLPLSARAGFESDKRECYQWSFTPASHAACTRLTRSGHINSVTKSPLGLRRAEIENPRAYRMSIHPALGPDGCTVIGESVVQLIEKPTHGTVRIQPGLMDIECRDEPITIWGMEVAYIPRKGYLGIDSFLYKVIQPNRRAPMIHKRVIRIYLIGTKPKQRPEPRRHPETMEEPPNGGSMGSEPRQTQPRCRDVGGYEAYMKRTGKVCRID